jgi:hypothetical protein
MSVKVSLWNRCSVRLYFQLFVGKLMSYLRCLCLLRIGVSNTYCIVLLFFLVFCTICGQFLWIVHFLWPFRCSLKRLFNSHQKNYHPCFLSVTHREVILWQQIQTRVIAWWSEYKFWCDQGNLDFFWQSFLGKLSLDVFIYGNNTVRLWINTHHIPRNLDNL